MKALVLCEESGVVRDAFASVGFDSWSCDLEPSRASGQHMQMDAQFALRSAQWDIVIAHPPCTYLCNSGVRWLKGNEDRQAELKKAGMFFRLLMDYCQKNKIPSAFENPIPHKYAVACIGRKYDQLIQPWQFGHGETKATCLWLEGLPGLKPTNIVEGRESRIHKMAPSATRSRDRSVTYQGIADAMAQQWGSFVKDKS